MKRDFSSSLCCPFVLFSLLHRHKTRSSNGTRIFGRVRQAATRKSFS